MSRPHSTCWIIAATAMVVLLSPSPAGVSVMVPAPFEEAPAVQPCSVAVDSAIGPWSIEQLLVPYPVEIAPHQLPAFAHRPVRPVAAQALVDPALGPWDVERLLVPYETTLTPEQLAQLAPQPVLPAAQLPQQPPAPVESALGPWRVEQFACPYQITVAPQRADEPVVQAPLAAPVTIDPALGPWDVERLLYPYPATVAPQRLEEFSGRLAEPLRPTASAAEPRAHMRFVMRVAGTARRLLGLMESGTQAARKAIRDLGQPATSTLGGQATTPDREGQAMPTQTDDPREGLKQLIEALDAFAPRPASWPDDDRGSFLLPWQEVPQTASDPFALEGRWTDADDELTIAPEIIMPAHGTSPPQHVAGLDRFFPPSTGFAFLAALLLIPASCSYAAGAVYGYARDGPSRRR
ncbi:MAG: hypothetical protein ACYTES_02720 [Planctomycetota bacterium]